MDYGLGEDQGMHCGQITLTTLEAHGLGAWWNSMNGMLLVRGFCSLHIPNLPSSCARLHTYFQKLGPMQVPETTVDELVNRERTE